MRAEVGKGALFPRGSITVMLANNSSRNQHMKPCFDLSRTRAHPFSTSIKFCSGGGQHAKSILLACV